VTVRAVPAASARFTLFPSMGEYPAYDDHVYDAFEAADDRCRAYRHAIRAAAPGRVVLDIGTGRDALWAIEAARCGARHVYAIEADHEVARRARQVVAAAGLGDQVTVLPGRSTEQTMPVRAEVCVSEIVGNIASAEGAVPVLDDARRRLTAPGCVWIPFRMQTWAAAVSLPPLALAAESLPYLRSVFAHGGGPFDLRLCLAGPAHEAVISTAAPVESVTCPADPSATCSTRLRVELPARMTGLLLWPRLAVAASGGREVDTLTGDTRGWAPVLVPLPATDVTPGTTLNVTFTRRTGRDGLHPDYELRVNDLPAWHSPHTGAPFRATPFYQDLFPEHP
jgi:protein arginine N-methyltransferase 1